MSRSRKWALAAALLCGAIVAAWHFAGPPYADDWNYTREVLPDNYDSFWNGEGRQISTWHQVLDSQVNHWKIVNGRLANLAVIALNMAPRWVSCLLTGSAMALTLWLLFLSVERLSGREVKPWLSALTALLVWKWLPMTNNMMSIDFFFNYGVGGALMMAYIYCLTSEKLSYWTVMLAFLLGWYQESFALPALAATGVYLLFRHHRLVLTVLCALTLGCALNMLAPSTFLRVEDASETLLNYQIKFMPQIAAAVVIFFVAFFLKPKAMKENIKKKRKDWAVWSIILLTGLTMTGFYSFAPRLRWAALLAAGVIVLTNLSILLDDKRELRGLASTFLAILLIWGVGLVCWQSKVAAQDRLYSELLGRGEEVIFDSPLTNAELPCWTMGLVTTSSEMPRNFVMMGVCKGGYKSDRVAVIVREENRGKPLSQWSVIDSDSLFVGNPPYLYSRQKLDNTIYRRAVLGKPVRKNWPLTRLFNDTVDVRLQRFDMPLKYSLVEGDTLYPYILRPSPAIMGRYVVKIIH